MERQRIKKNSAGAMGWDKFVSAERKGLKLLIKNRNKVNIEKNK